MKEEELCKKRLHDLSMQSYHKEIVLFSDFLNLNERNIYESNKHTFSTKSESFGGYELAERQMVAFIPDALCYEWTYPIVCLKISPKYPKFAEKLQHRDVLGALMHLGIERCTMGDLFQQDNAFYLFVQDHLCSFIQERVGCHRFYGRIKGEAGFHTDDRKGYVQEESPFVIQPGRTSGGMCQKIQNQSGSDFGDCPGII